MIVNNTPLETHELNGVPIIVKREDLCAPLPGPSFSKIRGVVAHLKNRIVCLPDNTNGSRRTRRRSSAGGQRSNKFIGLYFFRVRH